MPLQLCKTVPVLPSSALFDPIGGMWGVRVKRNLKEARMLLENMIRWSILPPNFVFKELDQLLLAKFLWPHFFSKPLPPPLRIPSKSLSTLYAMETLSRQGGRVGARQLLLPFVWTPRSIFSHEKEEGTEKFRFCILYYELHLL